MGAECGSEGIDQVGYLDRYLRSSAIGAKTLVVEHPYTDRHYLEEYQRYYASSLRAPPARTTRVHVFAIALDDDTLIELNRRSATGADARAEVQQKLQRAYRGFIVLRPLAAAPIGRTVLAPFSGIESRVFRCARAHYSHLLGLELEVESVPFQQQETAVGACATTAIWSALASASRATGQRGPTPYAITEGATRHVATDRQLPAQGGLELSQVVSSVRSQGFAPYVMKAADNYEVFTHSLKCFLSSGIPVVLLVYDEDFNGYHAMTAVGYRRSDEEHLSPPLAYSEGPAELTTAGLSRIYVHEDRLGPYARMSLSAPDEEHDSPSLKHLHFNTSLHQDSEPMRVHSAVVPIYRKLRLTPRGLLQVAAEIYPMMRRTFPKDMERLRVDLWFAMNGEYTEQLLSRGREGSELIARFVRDTPLPRYVGIVRFSLDKHELIDVVCDTTDIYRARPRYSSILALLALTPECVESCEIYFSNYVNR